MSVQLVNAETMIPFREHRGSDGNDYVEVEPDVEYWIRVQSDRQSAVLCDFQVDGKDTGVHETLIYPHNVSSDVGIWSKIAGQNMDQSLKVKNMQTRRHGDEAFWIGKVLVNFHEAIPSAVTDENPDFVNLWKKGNIPKVVASQIGTKLKSKPITETKYKHGSLLHSITLHYCTAMGLIHVGVLPKPEFWEYHRMRFSAGNEAAAALTGVVDIKPEVVKLQTWNPAGDLVEEKTYEMFDLTQLDENDESEKKVFIPRDVANSTHCQIGGCCIS